MTLDRVPRGVYMRAASELTAEHGWFDSYALADRVGQTLGRWVSYRSASSWIRRTRRTGGPVARKGGHTHGPGAETDSYAVGLIELRRQGLAK